MLDQWHRGYFIVPLDITTRSSLLRRSSPMCRLFEISWPRLLHTIIPHRYLRKVYQGRNVWSRLFIAEAPRAVRPCSPYTTHSNSQQTIHRHRKSGPHQFQFVRIDVGLPRMSNGLGVVIRSVNRQSYTSGDCCNASWVCGHPRRDVPSILLLQNSSPKNPSFPRSPFVADNNSNPNIEKKWAAYNLALAVYNWALALLKNVTLWNTSSFSQFHHFVLQEVGV